MDRRTKYAAPNIANPGSFGTRLRDPENNRLIPGEVNQYGLPMGQRPVSSAPSALKAFQASQPGTAKPPLTGARPPAVQPPRVAAPVAPAFDADAEIAKAKATTYGASTVPTFGLGMNSQPPRVSAPVPSAPAGTQAATPTPAAAPASRTPWAGVPTHPDDRALLADTRARDAAARAPEPVSIPGGDPTARAWNAARGTGHASTPEPGMPAVAPRDPGAPVPQLIAAAGTGQVVRSQYGTGSSTIHQAGMPESPAVVSNTGVMRAPAIAPRIAAPSPTSPMAVGDSGYVDEQSARTQLDAQMTPVSTPSMRPPSSSASMPSTAMNALGQSVAQTAGNRAMAIAGSVDRNVVKPVIDTVNAGRNFVSGLMGSNESAAPYSATPRMLAPRITQPPATTAATPAFPFKFNDPRFQMPSSVTPDASPVASAPSVTPANPSTFQGTRGLMAPAAPSLTGSRFSMQSGVNPAANSLNAILNPSRQASTDPLQPPLLTGPVPRKKATPLDEPANQYN